MRAGRGEVTGVLRVFKLLTANISGSSIRSEMLHDIHLRFVGHVVVCHKGDLAQLKPYSTAQKGIFVLGLMNGNLHS